VADNVSVTDGQYTALVSSDDVGGVQFQRIKLALGADGAWDADLDSGQQLMAASVPVTLASDQSAIVVSDGSGALTVDNGGTFAVQAAQSGTWNVGTVTTVTAVTAITNALPAGTNAIGKLAANTGVDIGDVDVLSVIDAANTWDHGRNSDIDTAAEQLTTSSIVATRGVWVKADPSNTGVVYIGNSDVTIATADGTDGYPLYSGNEALVPVNNASKVYCIGSVNNQIVHWRTA
jgi:hypothetical protein